MNRLLLRPRDSLERWLRPDVAVAGRRVSTFQICGITGFAAAVVTALALGAHVGLSPAIFAALAALAACTFLGLALVTRALLGEERLVYYHHEAAVLASSAIVLGVAGAPILPYLDVIGVAMGVFLVLGRTGCFAVGCCHGQPHRLGLRYGACHAEAGFPSALVGVPLVPVQAIEAIVVLGVAALGAARLHAGAAPGSTLAMQLVAYALVRFGLERLRCDAARPQWAGLSEAQWTSVAVAIGVVIADHIGWLPRAAWHDLATAALVVVGLVAIARRRAPRARLLTPGHVYEVAAALADDATPHAAPRSVRVFCTSLGVRLSSCAIDGAHGPARVYTLSGIEAPAARALSSLILRLRPAAGPSELLERGPDLFHLVVPRAAPERDGTSAA